MLLILLQINGIPYLGKTHVDTTESISEFFFREVTTPIHGTNTMVTCDNWFTSIPLIQNMKKEPYNIRITGTIRKNKKEIPLAMKVPEKEVPSTKFAFHNDLILLSHTPKKHKIVLLASSYTQSTAVDVRGKPEVILHYNATKGGTDSFDQLCHSYTTSRSTRRWPMRFFFGMLDQAVVNARILHTCKCISLGNNEQHLSAKQCLKNVIHHLVEPFLRERYAVPTIRRDIKNCIANILNIQSPPDENMERRRLVTKARCAMCGPRKDRKTWLLCPSCAAPMCDEHRVYLCMNCGGTD